MEAELLVAFGAATIRVATPLALAALGETITERGGVLNLGIEGGMLAGAFAAALAALHGGVVAGMVAGVTTGVVAAGILAVVSVILRGDQIITGTAVTLAMVGLTGMLAPTWLGPASGALTMPVMPPAPVPLLGDIPVIGPVLFDQPILSYVMYLAVPAAWWLLFRTRFGLELRAAGESPTAARVAGVRVTWVRSIGTIIGGGLAGLAGATLVLAQVGTFTERMTAGRGFIAIAIVVLGRWNPIGAAAAALLFGAATALQYLVQASNFAVPYQALLALPYLLALGVLATAVARANAPAALGKGDG